MKHIADILAALPAPSEASETVFEAIRNAPATLREAVEHPPMPIAEPTFIKDQHGNWTVNPQAL